MSESADRPAAHDGQQLALQSLTELSESGGDFGSLAQRTVERVVEALGAAAGSYTLLDPLGDGVGVGWYSAHVPPGIDERLRALSRDPATPTRRFAAGEGPFISAYTKSSVARPESYEIARIAGWTGYAALPVVIAERLEGILIAYFSAPLESLALEPRMLQSVARIVSISLANFRLRERLLDSERRYRTLFESSPDPYLVEAIDGTIVDANAAAAQVFGGTPESLRGLTLEQHASLPPEEAASRRQVALRGETGTFRGTGIRLDGSTFPEVAITSMVELDGERRILVLIRDLTDEERIQAELVQAQKMDAIGQLVSGVAHELNNPLAAILGFSQLIRLDARLPDDLRSNADLLVEEATRTRRIVQNLLDFARQRPPERHPTSIRALVDSILLLQSYSLGPGRIEVDIDIPDDLPVVELDRPQIQQVLVNLTQNAIHAVRAAGSGRIRIAAFLDGSPGASRVRVRIADDGAGVPSEHVDRLFVPFFTTKSPSEGTGLGLSVAFGIVASHGGALTYASGPNGRGATFEFDLPVYGQLDQPGDAPAVGEAGTAVDGAARPPAAARVLVLDDERSIRILLDKTLRNAGYEPVLAATGAEAVDPVREGSFDVVLCDHRMAGMSGTQVYDAVHEIRPDLARRFVFMSGDVLNADLQAFIGDHDVTLLAKPFDLESVGRTVREVLARDR